MIRVSKSEKWNQGFRLVQLKGNHFIFGISYDFTRFLTEFSLNELKNPDILTLWKPITWPFSTRINWALVKSEWSKVHRSRMILESSLSGPSKWYSINIDWPNDNLWSSLISRFEDFSRTKNLLWTFQSPFSLFLVFHKVITSKLLSRYDIITGSERNITGSDLKPFPKFGSLILIICTWRTQRL